MNRIKELRKEKNLTLDELSEKVEINRSTLNRYENEKSEPKLLSIEQKAVAICEVIKAFHTEPSDLSLLGGKANSGKMCINSVLNLDKDDYSVVFYSITGFYEKELRLSDLLK